jgi:hypothetical protein
VLQWLLMSDTLNASLSRWAVACAVLLGALSQSVDGFAQGAPPPQSATPPAANPMCVRLEGQLAIIDRGGGDPARAEQLRRYEDAASKQQSELDRVSAQARRMGCDSSGFFSMFNGQSQQCGPVNTQIQQMRGNLDQITGNLERLRVGTPGSSDRDSQRRSVLLALGQNNCGPQYAAAARSPAPGSGPGNFLNNLFGNNEPSPDAPPPLDPGVAVATAPSGTYRTVCVRTCDGSYFPISFATVQSRFADDERTCKSLCPASDANLFSYRNPGEDMNSAVSISGQPYTSSPNAFKYRTEFNPSCSCKAQGQTWSDALKNIDDKSAADNGDIIVTEERARKMSLPPAKGTPAATKKGAAPAPAAVAAPADTPAAAAPATPADPNKPIRSVGPTFIPTTR